MSIPIKADLIRELIRRRYGSVVDLAVEWEHRVSTKKQKQGEARDHKTIYRWLNNGMPSQVDELYGFAALLDVDPVCLVDINRQFVEREFGRERRLFRLNLPSLTRLAPLWLLYAGESGWPNQKLAETYFGRPWHVVDFVHDPDVIKDVYVATILQRRTDDNGDDPRAYHFAYRRVGVSDKMWRPYGVVISGKDQTTLVSESGDWQVAANCRERAVVAETHFGRGPAEFRIVSIHPFNLSLEVPSRSEGVVRFVA